ncbi:Gldg family protein [Pseudobacter ginsenosidimutans]|uniref:ABC-2 type transport system permease protein n=1 Tax=Pseudobacter ginsenosidimutans TaxID=661488 RepID=A0A4Q7MR28_9BACT|nr:Gldg family protein [Pseudobacter ginsenosidimutans]QEC42133.1 ABC transporter permease subunit [Pseudobacter ginsenosidimutans]RZS71027.1 ABC-2 type transport system permease protein [Pseudobacter ginsenosidimutans]
MKVILKIAKTELRTLFYSPIAWFLMIVFLIQCGIVYLGQLDMVTRNIEMSGNVGEFFTSVTNWIFLSQQGLFGNIMQNLYLYMPLLTMSLISRELNSGTIKLLYSSPIKVYEIVFGKYIAMMAYSLILVVIVGFFMVAGMFHIQHPETGMLLSAMFGFFLLLLAYSAIGLFMSCLTSYQVVAAISTFVMIGILSYIGRLWQDIDFVRELTYYLAINGRTQKMLGGLITTKDVLYFIIIIYIFLGLSIFRIRSGMESKPVSVKVMRYLAVVASALFIGYVSSIPGFVGYWDTTLDKSNTLTPRVQKIVKDLGDEPLEVTAYANLLDNFFYLGSPTAYNNNESRWESYRRFKHNIDLKIIRYYDTVPGPMMKRYPGKSLKEVAEQFAKSRDVDMKGLLTPQEIRKQIDLRGESNRFVMQLKWKGRTTALRVFDDMYVWPSETEVAAALLRLQKASLPKIAFITGELEREIDKSGDRDYKTLTNTPTFRYSLINQGFDVMNVSLETQDIPKDISSVVLADPKIELSASALAKLKTYISNGGNLMIAGEPGKQAVLNPLLQELGVQLNEGTIIQSSRNDAPNFVSAFVQKEAKPFYKLLESTIEDSLRLTMPGAASLSYADNGPFVVTALVKTNPKNTWSRTRPIDLETMINARVSFDEKDEEQDNRRGGMIYYTVNEAEGQQKRTRRDSLGTVIYEPAAGDVKGPFTMVVGLSRKINGKEQRIVVSGDADFLSNKEMGRQRTANFVFSTSLFRWMSNGDFPIDTSRPEAKDKKVNTSIEKVKFLRILYLWVLPAILLAAGAVLLIRRKRK